jgi:hypothetical protein
MQSSASLGSVSLVRLSQTSRVILDIRHYQFGCGLAFHLRCNDRECGEQGPSVEIFRCHDCTISESLSKSERTQIKTLLEREK